MTRIAIERGEPVRLETDDAEDLVRFEVVRSSSSYRHLLAGMRASTSHDLAAVMRRGLDSIPFGPEWLATLHTLAWTAIELRDEEASAELHARLASRAGRCAVYPLGAATGSSDRILMRLASVLGRHDEAERLTRTDPEVGQHLRLYLRTGKHCGYFPRVDDRVTWDVRHR